MSRCIDWLRNKGAPTQLVALNAAVFVAIKVAVIAGYDDVTSWVTLPSALSRFIVRPWTILTYMFVHFNFFHLVFNMLWLYWFGEFFLTLGNRRQLMALYLYGGLLGGAFYLLAGVLGWIGAGELCGASASVLGIVVATAWRMPRLEMPLLMLGGVQLRWLALTAVALGALTTLTGNNIGGGMAHLGGVLAGVLFAVLINAGVDISAVRRRQRRTVTAPAVRRSSPSVDFAGDDRVVLDALLDKVRCSGYTSLSSSERKKLLELSNRL